MQKRFVEDYNEPDESEESEISLDKINFKESEKGSKQEESEENEEIEEDEEVQNIFEDNFGSFSPGFRSRASDFSASLEAEPIQNLEKGMQDVPSQEQVQKREEPELPMMYNAPQYGSNYDAVGYPNRSETDITGGAATANVGREINMKRWQETALGYPRGAGGMQSQGEQYIRAPEKQTESRGLPFERGNQRRNVGWKEEY